MFLSSKSKISKIIVVINIMIMLMLSVNINLAQEIPSPTLPPVLDPKGAFQTPLKNFLGETFRLSSASYQDDFISLAVNSAQGLQYSQIRFSESKTAYMTLFLGLPGQSPNGVPNAGGLQTPFPPTVTSEIPRVVLDPQGVLSYAANSRALTDNQKAAIDLLYNVDLVSRGNYAANLLNLARALNGLRNSASSDDIGVNEIIDNTIAALANAYGTLADFNANPADPDLIYGIVAAAIRQLSTSSALTSSSSKSAFNTALNILGIGYSNYMFNRLPINGTNNPTPSTRGPLPVFSPTSPLSAAQATPGLVFGQGLRSYLSAVGFPQLFSLSNVVYQVNSADRLQAVIVPLENQTMTLLFTGANFPPTNANPPQVCFSTVPSPFPFMRIGSSVYAKIANNDPVVAQRVKDFFAANAGPRAAYLANLNNLLFGFTTLDSNPSLPPKVRFAVRSAIEKLQTAINGLNQNPAIIPDVLTLYKKVSADYDDVISGLLASDVRINFTDRQKTALITLGISTLPIGLINYYMRPVILSQV
ncbi:MAG: hypothetical protein J0M03_07410 [Acidobacteria bacterium]|nr:hypothetical protein [Acidobacteriota bacterium]